VEWETNCCGALVAEFERSGSARITEAYAGNCQLSYELLKYRVRASYDRSSVSKVPITGDWIPKEE